MIFGFSSISGTACRPVGLTGVPPKPCPSRDNKPCGEQDGWNGRRNENVFGSVSLTKSTGENVGARENTVDSYSNKLTLTITRMSWRFISKLGKANALSRAYQNKLAIQNYVGSLF